MNFNFVEIFNQKSEIVFTLAKLLEGGKPLPEALESLAFSCRDSQFRDAAMLAVDRLKNGYPPEEAFSSQTLFAFPTYCRYILSCPVADELKGKMLAGWLDGRIHFSIPPANIFYPIQTLGIGLLTATSTVMFVLPQFKEIMLSMRIEPTPFLKLLFMFEISLSNPIFLVFLALVGLAIFALRSIIRRLMSLQEIPDQIVLLSILEAVDLKDRAKALALLGNKILLPRESGRAKVVAESLMAGKSIAEACETAQVPVRVSWFLSLGLESENSAEMLGQGKEFFRNLFNTRMELLVSFMEVAVILILGTTFGSMIYGIFEMMSLILQRSIS